VEKKKRVNKQAVLTFKWIKSGSSRDIEQYKIELFDFNFYFLIFNLTFAALFKGV